MKKPEKLTLSLIAKRYSDEESAYKFLESVRWENGAVCPHCGNVGADFIPPTNGERKTKRGNKSYRRIWRCHECQKQFSVLVGTIFEDSHIPLSKWLLAIHELNADKNGISSCELARKLGVTQKSAWHMAHRIRFGMEHSPLESKLSGTVEADETYFGGEAKNMHKAKREATITGRGTVGKVAVFSIVERGGAVRSQTLKDVNSKNVGKVLDANVESNATLMTDTSTVYPPVGKSFKAHEMVDHSADEYVRKSANGDAHINTAEGHFSQLKRSIDGTHHHVSEKHLDRYLAEFDYRYTTRKSEDGDRTLRAIKQVSGKHLPYSDLIAKKW